VRDGKKDGIGCPRLDASIVRKQLVGDRFFAQEIIVFIISAQIIASDFGKSTAIF